MVAGGRDARPRTVLSISRGGKIVASVVLAGGAAGVGLCCVPPRPPVEPTPPVVIVDAAPEAGVDAAPDAEPVGDCRYREPRAGRAPRRQGRIVGGQAAEEGAWPYAVSLNAGSSHYCGGTVLPGGEWVLTAAHCMVQPGDIARVGNVDRRLAERVAVVESRIHADYDANTFAWDIAVVRLEHAVGAEPVRLAQEVLPPTGGDDAIAIGWGRLSEGGQLTNRLQEVAVPLVPLTACPYAGLSATQLCADTGGRGSCQGDSGGALLQLQPEGYVQVGVVSFGRGCARPDSPGVYTRVAHPEMSAWVRACARG